MAIELARLSSRRGFRHSFPAYGADVGRPVVVLLHGLGGDRADWQNPFQERNWPYDHRTRPPRITLGTLGGAPQADFPGLDLKDFMSPLLVGDSSGADGSDDRSWWHALVRAGFPVLTFTQTGGEMVPFTQGPVAEFKQFMATLQADVLADPALQSRPVVIVGHSRGGLIGRAYLGDPDVKADSSRKYPNVTRLVTLSSPHAGSNMAWLDARILHLLEQVLSATLNLPLDIRSQILNSFQARVDAYTGPQVREIRPGSPLYQALEAQEPVRAGVKCLSAGGTSPRFLRIYLWRPDYEVVRGGTEAHPFRLRFFARPVDIKGISPMFDRFWLKVLGPKPDELVPGRGDGLTADQNCRFPASFGAVEHLSFPLNHGEELWDTALQQAIIDRLDAV